MASQVLKSQSPSSQSSSIDWAPKILGAVIYIAMIALAGYTMWDKDWSGWISDHHWGSCFILPAVATLSWLAFSLMGRKKCIDPITDFYYAAAFIIFISMLVSIILFNVLMLFGHTQIMKSILLGGGLLTGGFMSWMQHRESQGLWPYEYLTQNRER